MEQARSVLITHRGNMNGERYLIDNSKKEVHDLFNVKPDCHISDIMKHGDDLPCRSLREAHKEGYRDCTWCIGRSKK
ncbi:hypothetical protein LVD17_25740 [Fulvivirga ulvae]|uniref:hypothetical protein n=1 Tax=Fulvivirga ulvae TaxID=2904245 RepID=UPI001F166D12|nr:hypothetical protein [Fulvivirga ulvae]UII31696.1 hypothetical protein LVD17_25740 [Fulvivirga ulvae]